MDIFNTANANVGDTDNYDTMGACHAWNGL